MANNGGKGFILTTKSYKNQNNSVLLAPGNCKQKGKADIYPEETEFK